MKKGQKTFYLYFIFRKSWNTVIYFCGTLFELSLEVYSKQHLTI
jgi:hypothetical protein